MAKKRQLEESGKTGKKHKFKRSQLPDNRNSSNREEQEEDQDDVSWYMDQLFKDPTQQDVNVPDESEHMNQLDKSPIQQDVHMPDESEPITDEVEEISPRENNDIEPSENDQMDPLDEEINCGHDQIDLTDQGINSSGVSKSLDGSDVKQQDAKFNNNFGSEPKINRRRYVHDVVFKKVKYFQDNKVYEPIKPFCGIKEYAVVEIVKEKEKTVNYFSSNFEHGNGNTENSDVKDNPFEIKNDLSDIKDDPFDIKDDPFDIEDDPLDAVDSNNQSVSGSTKVCPDQNKDLNKIVPGVAVVSSSMSLLMGYDSSESEAESPSVPNLNSSTDKHEPVDVLILQNISNKNDSESESCKNLSPVNMISNKRDSKNNSEDMSDPKHVYNNCNSINTQSSLDLENLELKSTSFGDCKNVLATAEESNNEIEKSFDSSFNSPATVKKKARRGSRGRKRKSGVHTAENSTDDSFADVENKDSNISEPNLMPVVDDNKCDIGTKIVKDVEPKTEAIKSESRFAHLKPITKSDKRYSNKNVIIRDLDPESSEITHLHNTLAREEKLSEFALAKKRKIFDKKYGQSLLNTLVNGRVGSRNDLFNSDSE